MQTYYIGRDNRTIRNAIFLMVLLLIFSCKKENGLNMVADRTVMVYMAANNNLAAEAYKNINQMEESFQDVQGNLIVYARIFGQSPKIYHISHDSSPEIKSSVLKTYENHDSSDPEVMKMVFQDIQNLSPARSYGLILWSHATNWYPAIPPKRASTKSFGDDEGSRMDLQKLKVSLPKNLDFLIFDACSMASVEVISELQGIAPYILASPTEVLSVGMPYHLVTHSLFEKNVSKGLVDIAKAYHAYYSAKQGIEQSATFAVIKTAEILNLARTTNEVVRASELDFSTINRNSLQRLDFDPVSPIVAYDFLDLFEQYFTENDYHKIKEAIEKVIVYKVNTPFFLQKSIRTFSGLSCYFPDSSENYVQDFYLDLDWTKQSGFNRFFEGL